MANNLTGDFDVVAEFSLPAANRVLAAMHSSERFIHSITMRVDDNPPPERHFPYPVAVAVVDGFGEAVANHRQVGRPGPYPGISAATNAITANLDSIVNFPTGGIKPVPVVPSHLQGTAQLQIFPPTVEIPDSSGQNVRVNLNAMARYLADPGTSPVAQFIRGDLHVTTSITQVSSQAGNVINFDFNANNASISFVPSWSSSPISAEDLAGINLLIKNAIKTSAIPSSMTLPSNIRYMRFRTLKGSPNALGILLNLNAGPGNPASVNNIFLGGADDFAFAVSVDYIRSVLQPTINNILSQTYSFTIPIDLLFTTAHVSYDITLSSATIDLQNGKIVFTIQGNAKQTSGKWYAPDSFSFTATLSFVLQADGDTADLIPTDVSLDTSSWVVNLFKGSATSGMNQVRDQALQQSGAFDTVRNMFSASKNLGGLFQSLFTPPEGEPNAQASGFQLACSSVGVQAAGIVMHGSLAVTAWPRPYVEYEQIPPIVDPHSPVNVFGHAYSALKAWIPGGSIDRFEWSMQGGQPFLIDEHEFVYQSGPGDVNTGTVEALRIAGYNPLCLTLQGTRLSNSGPVVAQPVEAKVCGYRAFPVAGGLNVGGFKEAAMIALAVPGPEGQLVVAGHTAAQSTPAGSGSPNRLVHFADDKSVGHLTLLTRALKESGRDDTMTAIMAVLTPEQLSKAPYAAGIVYCEDQGGIWSRLFGVHGTRPHTLIVGPSGKVLWRHDGQIDVPALAASLRQFLVKKATVELSVLRAPLRLGRTSPNFLFEIAPGEFLPFRKLAGAADLVFWRASSPPSIQAVLDLQATSVASKQAAPLLLAINDGDDTETAKKVAAENGIKAIVVFDPERQISSAYGVNIWPTIVHTDSAGMVSGIRYARGAGSVLDAVSGRAAVA